MKRSRLIFLLAAGCCLSAACKAKNQGGDAAAGNTGSANGKTATTTRPAKSDVDFAREAVEGLLAGDAAVAGAFDWENLKVPGAEAGEAYKEMPDDENREEFRHVFIENFADSFEQSGASVSDLKNWREEARTGDVTTVAVDAATGKIMRVRVTRRDGRQLVSELSIE